MKFAALLITLLVVGCSSTPVETQFYLLRQHQAFESRELKPSPDFALGKVDIAPYIDQPGLVLEVAPGQVRPAQYHEWAEPMHTSVRILLQRQISLQLGADLFPANFSAAPVVVEIHIDQLHGTNDGNAMLLAYWWTLRDGEIQSTYQYTKTLALAQDGYAALARAEGKLLSGLAESISDTLKTL
ncbi:MAG: ABC-type transport auxiliary lipoprotein family protein [Halioglobus sp.]